MNEASAAEKGARSVAVVGGGLSGVTAARALADRGYAVTVFERGRGPGGRASRKRVDGFVFDHGAQYFTARSPGFAEQVRAWQAHGVVAEWNPRMATVHGGIVRAKQSQTTRYVGIPGMSATAKDIAKSLELKSRHRVTRLHREASADASDHDRWHLSADTPEGSQVFGPFSAALLACTPEQGLPLLDTAEPGFAEAARGVRFLPTWALLLGFDTAPEIEADGLFISEAPLSWAARNDSKPGRAGGPAWVIHATGAWSRGREDLLPEQVVAELLPAFERAVGVSLPDPIFADAHRWKYARAEKPLEAGALWDAELRVGMCGDWCASSRVEGAWSSGRAAAHAVLGAGD